MSAIACSDKAAEPSTDTSIDKQDATQNDLPQKSRVIIREDLEPYKFLYVDIPNVLHVESIGTEVYIVDNDRIIAVISSADDRVNNIKDAHKIVMKHFADGIEGRGKGESVDNLVITKSEKLNINNRDMYKFIGTMDATFSSDTVYKVNVVGYSFICEEVSCGIWGIVTSKEQEEQDKQIKQIKQIETVIDKMVKTVEVKDME